MCIRDRFDIRRDPGIHPLLLCQYAGVLLRRDRLRDHRVEVTAGPEEVVKVHLLHAFGPGRAADEDPGTVKGLRYQEIRDVRRAFPAFAGLLVIIQDIDRC